MSKRRFIIFCISLLMFWGCPPKRVNVLPPDDPNDHFPEISNTLAVDVFLDATLSMKGFLVPGVLSYYEQTLPLLESAVGKGWEGGHTTFYRFGSHIAPIAGRAHVEATQPGFYTNPEYFQKTFIENVIDYANVDHLTIIATDLFQNEVDVNLLTGKLKEKYLTKNLAIGILGIKSEFAGPIYDVGVKNYTFEYNSGSSQPDRFRPFYLLILGTYADVEHYYEKLEVSGLKDFPVKNFIIFSRYLSHPLSSFENARMVKTNKIVETGGLLAPGLLDKRLKQFRLNGDVAKADFITAFKYFPLPYTVPFNPATLEPEITAWKHQANQLAENESAKRAFHINGINLSENELKVEAQLTPTVLSEGEVYCYRVILRPKDYSMPAWVSDWNMPTRSIEEWRKKPAAFNGATTFNLKPFLSDLWEMVVQLHRPKVGEFYCYVKRG
ncbi:MAG: hypothetical protein V7641_1783 [Blastocatellia bacterium]